MSNNFETLFRDSGDKLHMNPHPGTWGQLAGRLSKINAIKRKIRMLNYSLRVAVVMIILVNALWVGNYIVGSNSPSYIGQLEDYTPDPQSVSTPIIYRPSDTVFKDRPGEKPNQSSYNTLQRSDKLSLDRMVGDWKLAEEFSLTTAKFIPRTLHIFHTVDNHYYLQAGGSNSDAFLLEKETDAEGFKVMNPGIQHLQTVRNSIILYLANGLIIEYQKNPEPIIQ